MTDLHYDGYGLRAAYFDPPAEIRFDGEGHYSGLTDRCRVRKINTHNVKCMKCGDALYRRCTNIYHDRNSAVHYHDMDCCNYNCNDYCSCNQFPYL